MARRAYSRWTIAEADEAAVRRLAKECGLQMPAARVLYARGLRKSTEVEHFLHPRLSDLLDPFLMRDMERAVERIREAVKRREKILLYGDYDVDGTSAVVILTKMIELMGHSAEFHLPHRLRDGYGVHTGVLEDASKSGVTLVVAVDTGIRAAEPIEAARRMGIDFIVADHHLPEEELPSAFAILNPNRPDCPYPNKNLCGAGVAFKLVQGLMEREGWTPDRMVRFSDSFLVMAAIATVADVVPLTGENRVIVKRGLKGLEKTKNLGLRALMSVSGLDSEAPVSATDVGFRIAPRINAAGRMDHARDVVELMLTADEGRTREIAARLNVLNAERQAACSSIVAEIRQRIGPVGPPAEEAGLVYYDPNWHRGVVGIVANRLTEEFNRPAIVLGRDDKTGLIQGSGRSVPGFHLLEALESMKSLFVRFGGHRAAVGLTVEESRVEELRARFGDYVRAALGEGADQRELFADAFLKMDELTDRVADEVLQLAPFGLGNRQPVFLLEGFETQQPPRALGRTGEHLQISARVNGSVVEMKAWGFADRAAELPVGAKLDLAVVIDQDNFSLKRGGPGWSVVVRDVRPSKANT
jgi:single-stranded-DNA-specific exonuclease